MSEFEHLGPYKIGNVIGRGGMGLVYEATHAKTGEVVAVKLIAQHVADDQRFRRRFDAEVETLRRLRHPGIVRLIGYGEEAGRLFYSMELVRGESLQQRIRDVKRMGWLPCVDIAIQICSALKHAHDIGVVHRDLKPANLLLTESNEVKLVDFGIAKLFGYGEQTMAGSVLGTADYMAPEQAGDGPITPRTDLYALGSVMYAMMSGRSPFAGKKLTQVIESLKNDRAVPLELINPDIPSEVVEIVHQLLEKTPQLRPPTALSVMKRLKATRAGLQRGRTVAFENELTHSGDRPLVNEVPTPESDTHHSHITNASQLDNVAGKSKRERQESTTNVPDRGENEDTDARLVDGDLGIQNSPTPTNESLPPTMGSHLETNGNETDFATGHKQTPQTRFQSIAGEDREAMVMGRESEPPTSSHVWVQSASIAAMIAILAGGVYLFFNAIQAPSADQLFAEIEQAETNEQLTLSINQIERFLNQYPDDDRAAQVQQWGSQADLEQTLKRIAAQARRVGGIHRLEPAKQSFYRAMELRGTSTNDARTQLAAWLDVFAVEEPDSVVPTDGSPPVVAVVTDANDPLETDDRGGSRDGSTPLQEVRRRIQKREIQRLAVLAQDELRRLDLNVSSETAIDDRLVTLKERLAVAQSLPPAKQKRMLRSLIQLYRDQPWAATIVSAAQSDLGEMSDLSGLEKL